VVAVLVCLLDSCTGVPAPTRLPAVDPQVLQDVIDASFMVPGDGVRRAMRVREFNHQAGIRKCGGQLTRSLDTTANRWQQNLFPDLELIREKGFGGDQKEEASDTRQDDKALESISQECKNLFAPIPDFETWFALQGVWYDTVLSQLQAPAMVPLKKPMAICLTDRSGLKVGVDDPPTRYLAALTKRWLALSKEDWEAQKQAYSDAFVDCGRGYYETLTKLLLPERDKLVEQNREVLTSFAIHLVEAGYVP
jgi:hypothetical protein